MLSIYRYNFLTIIDLSSCNLFIDRYQLQVGHKYFYRNYHTSKRSRLNRIVRRISIVDTYRKILSMKLVMICFEFTYLSV